MEDIVCSFSAVEWMDASLMAMTSKMLEGMPRKLLKHIWDISQIEDPLCLNLKKFWVMVSNTLPWTKILGN